MTAVVTGVSRGIGRATALALADRGIDVALFGRPSEAHEATRAACEERGVRARSYACDLGDAASVERAGATLLDELGPPRAVVHNAAELEHGPLLHELPVERFDRIVAVNLRGPFVLTRALLPAMLAARAGRFVFVSSISATIGCPRAAAYGASKWGLLGLMKALAEELRGTGLTAVAVLPGSVDTAMLEKTPFSPAMPPEEVAAVIVYQALDAPAAMNGAAVEVFG